MAEWPLFEENLAECSISAEVLAMADKELMEKRFFMPVAFDEESGQLTLVTSRYSENFLDLGLITSIFRKTHSNIQSVNLLYVEYPALTAGYNAHYKTQFTPSLSSNIAVSTEAAVTTEQTRLSEDILKKAIDAGASDVHITPVRDGSVIMYRVDGVLRRAEIALNLEDELMVSNIYKNKADLAANSLVPQDGRFSFLGKNIRLSTMPYGGDGRRNKIVLRILSTSDIIPSIEDLGFDENESTQLRMLMNKPSGIMLVCGPTGEGKTTTQYAILNELNRDSRYAIVTFEDPIERYIDGIAQSQVRDADNEKTRYTFLKGLRSALRQDPDIILIGEIRDAETALTAVQSSQTGHLIFSTLHVRNSISVFRRLNDMGVNVSGFAEQIVGIVSQRLLSVNCPHCRKRIESGLNSRLRKQDLDLLEEGKYSYESAGCPQCGNTGILGRVPIIEIIPFNNFLRDYFSERHGLIDIEIYLRENIGFRSLWDKGMGHVAKGNVSLAELLSRIEPDEDLTEYLKERESGESSVHDKSGYFSKRKGR